MPRRPLVFHSLLGNLLAWALGALVLVWATFIALGYWTGETEADELTDGHLASVATLFLSQRGTQFAEHGRAPAISGRGELRNHDYQQSLSVVVWDAAGHVTARTGGAPMPPFVPAWEGFETLHLGTPAVDWRAFSRWDAADHNRKIMVLLDMDERDALAQDIAGQVAGPGIWLLPVVALALGLAIRWGLKPLYALSADVDAMDIQAAEPLRHALPEHEFQAVVASINVMAQRYKAALGSERELANELAHELRTPLASITLLARGLRDAQSAQERAAMLTRLEDDTRRAARVLGEVLALARASRAQWGEAAVALELAALASDAVAGFAQEAHRSGHELVLKADRPFRLVGHPLLFELVLRNLIENALHHTPPGTSIEVQVDAGERWLQVCSNPGTSDVTAPAVARHPGIAGLGLGHRVVEKIAQVHAASFTEVATSDGAGRCYRLKFPA